MGIVITRSKTLVAASVNVIAHTQTPLGAGNLTLTSSPVTLDTQRRVLFTFAGDETGHTFVVYGTKQGGAPIQESVAGTTAGTVATFQDFLTVSRISISTAATAGIQVGTNGVGATDWQSVDLMRQPVNVGIAVTVTGTVNYTVQSTNQDINNLSVGQYATSFDHPQLTGQTVSNAAGYTTPIAYFRLQINSGTGSCSMAYEQAGP